MSTRKLLSIIAASTAIASPLAFASQDGWITTNDEAGSRFVGTSSTLTREQVKRELEIAQREGNLRLSQGNASFPRTAAVPTSPRAGFTSSREERSQAQRSLAAPASSGWRYIGGEAGWVFDNR